MNFKLEFFDRFELLISSIGVVLGFFFGLLLLAKENKKTKANFFLSIYLLVISIRAGKAMFHNYYTINDAILSLFIGLFLIIGPNLWFYVKQLHDNNSLKKKNYYLHYIPFFLVTIYSSLMPNITIDNSSYFYLGIFLHGLIYCFYSLYWLLKAPKLEFVLQTKMTIKKWLIILIIATILIFINSILIFFNIVPFYPSSTFLFSFLIVFAAILGYRNLWLFEDKKDKYSNSTLDNENAKVYSNLLNQFMERDKLFLNPELTLAKLAERMNISSKQLSQIINQSENTNYSQYIAKYRIEEAKGYLRNPDFHNYKIAAIAEESGFNSISSFNTTFKRITNTTAIDYRESFIKNHNHKRDFVCQNHEFGNCQ